MRTRFSTPVVITLLLLFGGFSRLFAGDNIWTCVGPYGGQFMEFAFHPRLDKLVYASSTSGIYRSTDAGLTWKRITDLGGWGGECAHVLIPPKDDTKIIAIQGIGVYTSIDRGDTWQEVSYDSVPSVIEHAAIHPTDPAILFGVTRDHGIYKSTDGGLTWAAKNKGIRVPTYVCCQTPRILIDPTNGDNLYALLSGATAYRSTNGGESWSAINSGLDLQELSYAFAIDPRTPSTLYAGGGGICKSTDSGSTWVKLTDKYSLSLSVDAHHPSIIYSTDSDGTIKSTNSGVTWTPVAVDPWRTISVAVDPLRSNLVFVGGYYQGISRSSNSGKSWPKANTGIDSEFVKYLVRSGPPVNKLFAAAFEALLVSTDAGRTWTPSSIMTEVGRGLIVFDAQVHPRNPRLVILAMHDWGAMGVALSKDGGETWKVQPPLTTVCSGSYANTLALDPTNESTFYICPRLGCGERDTPMGVAKSTDQGQTWRYVNNGLSDKNVRTLCTDPHSGSILYAGTINGRFFASTNGGQSWQNRSRGLSSAGAIYRIAINPRKSSEIYIAADRGVFKSTDYGRSWNRWAEDYGMVFVTFHPSSSGTVFAGVWGGLFVSTDDGETWSAFDSTGLGPFGIHDLLIDPATPQRLVVATDRGVFSYTIKVASGGPVIEQISPATGVVGDVVTVNGNGFGPLQGDSKVLFGAIDTGLAQSWTDTSIRVTVPSGVRTGYVTSTVLGKTSNPFEFIVLPATGNIEPTRGPVAGGTRVTILAPEGIANTQFNVVFGSTLAKNVRITQPNIITCDSPPGTGTVDVNLSSVTSTAKTGTFTYE